MSVGALKRWCELQVSVASVSVRVAGECWCCDHVLVIVRVLFFAAAEDYIISFNQYRCA